MTLAPLIVFSDLLTKRGVSLKTARLLRHDKRGLAHWSRSRSHFASYASYQLAAKSPYAKAETAFQFLPGPALQDDCQTGLFVGAHRILDRWPWDGVRLPSLHDPCVPEDPGRQDLEAFDLEWLTEWDDLAGRILVRWGSPAATRSWSQWAQGSDKEVLELRISAASPPFPGFDAFTTTLDDLLTLPQSWREALGAVAGVYVLTCPDTGELYVGSAAGKEGFWQRWANYAAAGHGGNAILAKRGQRNYRVSILQIASTLMSSEDVLAMESRWKVKLGSRAHGLNAN
jgi:hypothetical protein